MTSGSNAVYQLRRCRSLSPAVWFGVAVGCLLVAANAVALVLLRVHEVGEPAFNASGIGALLVWVGVVATTEEMMLRGLLLTRFKEIAGPAGAVATTAAIFALMYVGRSDFSPLTVLQYLVDGVLVALLLGGTLVAFGEPLLTPVSSASAPMSATADIIAYLVSMPLGLWLLRSPARRTAG